MLVHFKLLRPPPPAQFEALAKMICKQNPQCVGITAELNSSKSVFQNNNRILGCGIISVIGKNNVPIYESQNGHTVSMSGTLKLS